ncbi:MAG: TIGR03986 family CRISPR-associated RAMP protein [Succinivibrio sp.]
MENVSRKKHGENYKFSDKYATAPYNFIKYDAKKLLKPSEDADVFSGTITCSLKTLTPLLIGSDNKKQNREEINEREFFKLNNGEIVIPGTSLKGMIRSYVEALSRSYISIINDKKLFYRNVTGNNSGDYKEKGNFPNSQKNEPILGGYLKKDGSRYYLYPAEVLKVKDSVAEAYKTGPICGSVRAYLFKNKKNTPLEVPPQVMKDFFLQMTDFQKTKWDKEEKIAKEHGEGCRVFYTVETNDKTKIKAIGIARFFRIAYTYKPIDLVQSWGTAESTWNTDFSLHLFGCANKQESFKGKVSVEPAYFSKFNIKNTDEITCTLGSPHATALLHYLKQPRVNKPQGNKVDDLVNYNTRGTELRGRKFYWHRDPEVTKEVKNKKVASHLKPIATNSEAEFVVHLDRVNITELGVLLKVLNLKKGHALKLGAGKSVGLGSVEICIVRTDIKKVSDKYASIRDRLIGEESVSLTENDLKDAVLAFEKHAIMKNESSFDEQEYVKEFYKMTDFINKPQNKFTNTMPLEAKAGDPNFAKSKAMLLSPLNIETNKL